MLLSYLIGGYGLRIFWYLILECFFLCIWPNLKFLDIVEEDFPGFENDYGTTTVRCSKIITSSFHEA
jgi:hypothetical protein